MSEPTIREQIALMKRDAQRNGEGPTYLFISPEVEAAIELSDPDIWGALLGEKLVRRGARATFGSEIMGMRVIWDSKEFKAMRSVGRDDEDRYEKQKNAERPQ